MGHGGHDNDRTPTATRKRYSLAALATMRQSCQVWPSKTSARKRDSRKLRRQRPRAAPAAATQSRKARCFKAWRARQRARNPTARACDAAGDRCGIPGCARAPGPETRARSPGPGPGKLAVFGVCCSICLIYGARGRPFFEAVVVVQGVNGFRLRVNGFPLRVNGFPSKSERLSSKSKRLSV